jgi:hypothetical protein
MAKKDLVKRLKPKGKRIDEAAQRIVRGARETYSGAAGVIHNSKVKTDKLQREYMEGRRKAEADLGYAPGEKIGGRSISGVDRYSGSAYRIGKGAPQYPSYPSAEESKIRQSVYAAENKKELASRRYIKSDAKKEIKSRLASVQRANPRRSVKGKVVKGALGAAAVATIVQAVLKELNKK